MSELLLIRMQAERMDSRQLEAELRRIAHARKNASPRQAQRYATRAVVMLEAWSRLNVSPAHQCPHCGRPWRGAQLTLCDVCSVAACGGTYGT